MVAVCAALNVAVATPDAFVVAVIAATTVTGAGVTRVRVNVTVCPVKGPDGTEVRERVVLTGNAVPGGMLAGTPVTSCSAVAALVTAISWLAVSIAKMPS